MPLHRTNGMIGLSLAVGVAIVRRKQLEEHTWWLVSTVFMIRCLGIF